MKRLLTALLFVSFSTVALAQTAPQRKFVPFTVDEKTAQEIQTYLNEVPFKYAAPVLQWLAMQEQRAAQAEDQKNAPPPPVAVTPK